MIIMKCIELFKPMWIDGLYASLYIYVDIYYLVYLYIYTQISMLAKVL